MPQAGESAEAEVRTHYVSVDAKPVVVVEEVAKDAKPKTPTKQNGAKEFATELAAGAAYCLASLGMTLTNKFLLSAFDLKAPLSILFVQFLVTLLTAEAADKLNLLRRDPFSWEVVKIWWPVNAVFVAMIGSGFYALRTLQVPMLTLLKNLTNLLTILGDLYFFGIRYSTGVWSSLGLMAASAVVGSATDLSFEVVGYSWQIVNCAITACYALLLKNVLNRVAEANGGDGLSDITKVFYNNLLGLPWLFAMMLYFGEIPVLMESVVVRQPAFQTAVVFSGVVGFLVSYTSIRFMTVTTPTTFTMVGSMNKIPTAILGWIVFSVQTTVVNVASVMVGLLAGIVFVRAKAKEKTVTTSKN